MLGLAVTPEGTVHNRYYTTHQVASLFGVSIPTVVNWTRDRGLRAHKTPGGHRRIGRTDLIQFARENGYDVPTALLETGSTTHRRRILVVDDEPDFSEMVQEYLTNRGGFEVETAVSGFQAGFALARFKPDLILLDLRMPGMDGFEVHQTIRSDPETRHIPVIACSAMTSGEMSQRIETADFDGSMDKPVRLNELLTLIESQLGVRPS